MSAPTPSDRIAAMFRRIRGRAALVPFLCGGDPTPELMPDILHAAVRGGADMIEIGMPFSDPMADGPTIQQGDLRALAAGMTTRKLLEIVRAFRAQDAETPLVMMGYLNPVLAYGDDFCRDAKAAGLDGLLIVDLPPEEADTLLPAMRTAGLHLVRLATPTTDAQRLPAVLDGASGFLYYVAVAGTTGQKSASAATIADALRPIRAATDLPLAVGFGVRTPEQAAAIARHADAVVVGSAIVERIGAAADVRANDIPFEVERFIGELAAAVHGARNAEGKAGRA